MALGIYFIGALLVVCVMLSSYFLGERGKSGKRSVPYESGILSTGTSKVRFFAHYYLVALLFVIFDVESVFLYLWSCFVRELGWIGLVQIGFFVGMLFLALFYVFSIGLLDFSMQAKKMRELIK